jgi:serine/threonine-protein kinase RsbW
MPHAARQENLGTCLGYRAVRGCAACLARNPIIGAWIAAAAAVRGAMAHHELSLDPDVAGVPRLLDWVEQVCTSEGLPRDFMFKVALALEEAVVNVINHAFDGVPPPHVVQVNLYLTATLLAAEVVDNGHPFDPSAEPDPDHLELPLEERDPGGLGIHLMRGMMDRVEYSRIDGHNRLRLEKARDGKVKE